MKDSYFDYDNDRLEDRRMQLCLVFARKATKHERLKDLFPLNQNNHNLRENETYAVKFARTARLNNSSIPYLRRLLNDNA